MKIHDLNIDPVLQESCVTCGAAAARMTVGAGAPSEQEMAARISVFMQQHVNNCFITSPEALADSLSAFSGRSFRVERRQNIKKINRFIVNVLLDRRLPVPVLIKQCAHWIVASGLIYEEDQYGVAVSTFIVDDPFNPCLDCNSNGMVNPLCNGGQFGGIVEDEIPAAAWRKRWLTPCDCEAERELVCVVPGDAMDGPRDVREWAPEDSGPSELFKPINTGDLDTCLQRAKSLYGLETSEKFRIALDGARILRARVVSAEEGAYFLAEVGRERTTALFLFDRVDGSLISAKALGEEIDRLLPGTPVDMRKEVQAWRTRNGIAVPFESSLNENTPLTWKPTREFRSPYFPYLEMEEGGGRLFMGINRMVYPKLHAAKA
jgi:hypothetical protein